MIFVNQNGHAEWTKGIACKGRKGKAQRANGAWVFDTREKRYSDGRDEWR